MLKKTRALKTIILRGRTRTHAHTHITARLGILFFHQNIRVFVCARLYLSRLCVDLGGRGGGKKRKTLGQTNCYRDSFMLPALCSRK